MGIRKSGSAIPAQRRPQPGWKSLGWMSLCRTGPMLFIKKFLPCVQSKSTLFPRTHSKEMHVFHLVRTPENWMQLSKWSFTRAGSVGLNSLLCPDGHIAFDAVQDRVGSLGCKCRLPTHSQFFIHQSSSGLLSIYSSPAHAVMGTTQIQDLSLGLDELHENHLDPVLSIVKVPLDGIPHVSTVPLTVICKLSEVALDSTIYVIDEDIKWLLSQYRILQNTHYWFSFGHWICDYNSACDHPADSLCIWQFIYQTLIFNLVQDYCGRPYQRSYKCPDR